MPLLFKYRIILFPVLTSLLLLGTVQAQTTNAINPGFFNSWINRDYYNEIVSTKSLYKNYKNNAYHFISVNKESSEVLITTLTEGQTLKCLAESENKIKVLNKESGTPAFALSLLNGNDQVSLTLIQGKDTTVFIPLNKKYTSPDLPLNIERFINDQIMSGNYKDVRGNKSFVFSPNGSLSGFGKYNYYLIPLNGIGTHFNFDTILLQEREILRNNQPGTIKSNLFLHWEINHRNMVLYRLSENSPNGVIAEKYLELIKTD